MTPYERKQRVAVAEAIASTAMHRDVMTVMSGREDRYVRAKLNRVIRDWDVYVPKPSFTTGEAASERVQQTGPLVPEEEHIIPVRIFVERLMVNPREARALLPDRIVFADVTWSEHVSLPKLIHVPELHYDLLTAPPTRLLELGLRRYELAGIKLRPVAEQMGQPRLRGGQPRARQR